MRCAFQSHHAALLWHFIVMHHRHIRHFGDVASVIRANLYAWDRHLVNMFYPVSVWIYWTHINHIIYLATKQAPAILTMTRFHSFYNNFFYSGGIFLLLGYSSMDEELLRAYTNLGIQDTIRAFQQYIYNHIDNQVCHEK